MILLGLILIALGAALGVVAYLGAAGQSQVVELTALGWTRGFTVLELLAIGAAAMLLIWLGWATVGGTMRRRTRARREEREQERYAELERNHAEYRAEQERTLEERRLRDEDFARREEQIQTRQAEVELREEELSRRETAWRDRERPTVADVVTGRAEGQVSSGTAEWVDDGTTRPVGTPAEAAHHETDERVADERLADERLADERVSDQRVAETRPVEETPVVEHQPVVEEPRADEPYPARERRRTDEA